MGNKLITYIGVEGLDTAEAALKQHKSSLHNVDVATAASAREAERSGIIINRAYTQGAASVKGLTEATKTSGAALKETADKARAAEIPIVRSYQNATSAAKEYAREANKAAQAGSAGSLPPLIPLTAAQRTERTQASRETQGHLAQGARGVFDSPFADFSAKATAAKATADAAHAGQAALAKRAQQELNAEVAKSSPLFQSLTTNIKGVGTPLAGITSGILGANAITAATSSVVDFGLKAIDVYQSIGNEQRNLISTSIEFGRRIKQDLKDIEGLRASGLPKSVALGAQSEAIRFAEKAGQPNKSAEIARAAADYAAGHSIGDDQIGQLIKAASTKSGIEEITGRSDEQIQETYKGIHSIVEELNEVEIVSARLDAFQRSSLLFSGQAATQAASLHTQLTRLNSVEGVTGILANLPLPATIGGLAPAIRPTARLISEGGNPQTAQELQAAQARADAGKASRVEDEFWASVARNAKEAAEESKKAAKEYEEAQKKQKAARKELSDLTGGLFVESSKENGFVGLFVKARTDAEALREKIAELRPVFEQMGDAAVDAFDRSAQQAVELQRQISANALAAARFQSQSSALKFQQEARRLRDPQVGLSGPDERELDVFRARTSGAVNVPRLLAEASGLEGNGQVDAFRVFKEQLEKLTRLRSFESGALQGAERGVLNREILELTSQIDPRVLATDPRFRDARDARVGALRGTSAQYQADINDALERQRAGSRLQTDAREQLRLLQSSGLNNDEKLKQFLAITGTLSDKELTGDLRLGRARALDEAARVESGKEAAAEKRAQKLEKFVDTFSTLLTGNGLKVDAPPANLNFTVGDGLELEGALGAAPRPDADVYGNGRGRRTIGDDL